MRIKTSLPFKLWTKSSEMTLDFMHPFNPELASFHQSIEVMQQVLSKQVR
jgi:hypothetical protein